MYIIAHTHTGKPEHPFVKYRTSSHFASEAMRAPTGDVHGSKSHRHRKAVSASEVPVNDSKALVTPHYIQWVLGVTLLKLIQGMYDRNRHLNFNSYMITAIKKGSKCISIHTWMPNHGFKLQWEIYLLSEKFEVVIYMTWWLPDQMYCSRSTYCSKQLMCRGQVAAAQFKIVLPAACP